MDETVRVDLGTRGYDIRIGGGLIDRAGALMAPLLRQKRAIVVTDETVARLHLPRLAAALEAVGIEQSSIVVPAGEGSKSFDQLERLMDVILGRRIERGTALVALGGGVVGDLTGFAAAIALRGIDFVQVPTTLLAQVDSSVGGKTGINNRHGKNLIGAFHQPRLVLADTDVLNTLDRRELLAGYAEVVKYGLIDDPGFFAWCEANGARVIAGDAAARAHAVRTSCEAKARVVGQDEREEGGQRALLNLGHTFGHALEAETGYGAELLHGEAVAIGMVMAFDLSVALGLCPADDAARVRAHLAGIGLPTAPDTARRNWDPSVLVSHMAKDKKVKDGRLTFILARGIGRSFVSRDVPLEAVQAVLAQSLAA